MGRPAARIVSSVLAGCLAASLAAAAGDAAAQQQQPAQQKRPAPARGPEAVVPPATGQIAPPVVAVIDVSTILREATATASVQTQMQAEQDAYQAELERQLEELKAAEDDLERQRSSVTPEVFAEKRRALQERATRSNNDARARRRQLDEAFDNALAEIQNALAGVIDEVARRHGANLILRRDMVVFSAAALDLTEETLAEFNARMPTLKVVVPPLSEP